MISLEQTKMSEDTRIIRFIDAKYAQDWVGTYSPIMQKGELSYNFRFGLLSDYRKSEGLEGDCEEATINLAGLGKSGICNDALHFLILTPAPMPFFSVITIRVNNFPSWRG